MSDLHLEFNPKWRVPVMEGDSDTVLLLAGDITTVDSMKQYEEFFEDICNRFKSVIYLFGNHEYYHGSLVRVLDKYREFWKAYDNLFIIEKDVFELDENIVVIAATLWTDMNNDNPLDKVNAHTRLNDYFNIRTGTIAEPYQRPISPEHTVAIHKNHLEFLEKELVKHKDKTVIVMSHHAPSTLSIHDQYRGDSLNAAYYTDLSEFIFKHSPRVWIHGHCHNTFDYQLFDTRVICNPKGYCQHYFANGDFEKSQNTDFDPSLRLEL